MKLYAEVPRFRNRQLVQDAALLVVLAFTAAASATAVAVLRRVRARREPGVRAGAPTVGVG